MIIAVNVIDGMVAGGLGRAQSMAVADVQQGEIVSWAVVDVGWDVLHDQPDQDGHGAHHARIVRFMKDNQVQAVVTGHAGPPMVHTLELMGIPVYQGASGDAREWVIAVADVLTDDANAD